MHLPEIVNSSWLMVNRNYKTTNYELRTTNRKSSGFTLIELLVVISIIAILMAVATVSYTNAQQKGRDNKRKSDLKAVQQALELYFQQNGKYPSSSTGSITCNTGTGSPPGGDNSVRSWGSSFSCDPDGTGGSQTAISYMNPIPKEPSFTATPDLYYYNSPSLNSYIISAKIENGNDKDIAPFALPCTPQTGRNYCVINP